MGQYHVPVNLDKREYVSPGSLGDMLKIADQIWGPIGGTNTAIFALLAISSGRGGGDFYDGQDYKGNGEYVTDEKVVSIHDQIVGRWGGDRIAVVGDYTTTDDLDAVDDADLIYSLCNTRKDVEAIIKLYQDDKPLWAARLKAALHKRGPYKDIGPKVRQFFESQDVVKYKRHKWVHRDLAGKETTHVSIDRVEV